MIGVNIDAIERGEDRIAFKDTMNRLGIEMPLSEPAYNVEEAEKIAAKWGYPFVIRPAYTMGGTGGGLVCNQEELRIVASRGISASLVGQILVEESLLGWEELELEVVRNSKSRMITVSICFIENVDAMGVHTGDSYCTAPMLTIAPELQQRLQKYSYDIVEAIQVIGPGFESGRLPDRVHFVPACCRAVTLDKYIPWGEYVVVKFSRWDFEKFPGAIDKLGTQMRAVGEVMSIGKNYKEAFLKVHTLAGTGQVRAGFCEGFQLQGPE